MKKLLSLLLILAMLLSLAGCGVVLDPELSDPIRDGLVIDAEGAPETAGDEQYADLTEDPDEYSDEILEFTTDGAVEEDHTDPTETTPEETAVEESTTPPETAPLLDENGSYTTKEDVALYIYTYHKLPSNFITKKEAQALGWPGGSLEPYAPGKCIGGDRFGNYEGLLPTNHKYTECDIDTLGAKSRGAKRIVFSNDFSLIYYTDDHYESFTLLYGEE